jgi:flagellar biosynthetic protein FliQ
MQEGDVGTLLREAMLVVLKLSLPPLGIGLAVGLLMSLVQAVTQINEQTLSFVPKALAIGLALTILGPFMLTTLGDFQRHLLDRIVAVGSP